MARLQKDVYGYFNQNSWQQPKKITSISGPVCSSVNTITC